MNCSILLIDDHALFRAGLRLMLTNALSDAEIREAASLDEALAGGRRSVAPQLILLDIQLPGLNGLDGMTLLARQWPDCPVVVLSADSSVSTERSAMERGAHSFLSKAAPAPQFLETVRTALAGQRPAPASNAAPAEQGDSASRLTARQCEVLALLCQGLSNKLIGQRLHLSENTVRGHVQAILAALGVSSRAEAAFAARTRGLVG
ncbi:response regulator [Pseudoduganella sp. FT93W]|uniref:Response regulator n=1 Tax=Duganella fentianensis TaxID=2692177 RepID=A0A845I5S4_9BURK|nr:response regulator transcription factor [Duganella fentianensis]MYN47056.1 response regulator [Duganella fentianensis]